MENGTLVRSNGGWNVTADARPELPSTVDRVLLARIDRLPDEDRDVLTAASLLGRRFSSETLATLLGRIRPRRSDASPTPTSSCPNRPTTRSRTLSSRRPRTRRSSGSGVGICMRAPRRRSRRSRAPRIAPPCSDATTPARVVAGRRSDGSWSPPTEPRACRRSSRRSRIWTRPSRSPASRPTWSAGCDCGGAGCVAGPATTVVRGPIWTWRSVKPSTAGTAHSRCTAETRSASSSPARPTTASPWSTWSAPWRSPTNSGTRRVA